jgi:hypothetical protein
MFAKYCLLMLCVSLAGCASGSVASGEDANVTSSLQYDTVPCKQLVTERNALAARHGLSQDAKTVFSSTPTGLGTVLPDMRGAHKREADQASGEIDAMNRSLVRRKCAPKPEAG